MVANDIKLWGNPASHYDEDGDQLKCSEVLLEISISASPAMLRQIAAHFVKVAQEMETTTYDHWHWRHTTAKPDIVICRPEGDE